MTTFPNTLKFIKNTALCVIFSTLFSLFGNVVKHSLWCLIFNLLLPVLSLHSVSVCKIAWWSFTKKELSNKFRSTLKNYQCCKYLQDFLKIQMCCPHHTPFIRQSVLYIYNFSFIFSLFCRLQSLRILQRKRKRILKHFSSSSLLQNQVTFVRNYSIYQPITDFTEGRFSYSSMGTEKQRL